MEIAIRKVKIYKALSEETTAYSAEVLINGKPLIAASNDGKGGCDRLQPLKGCTYADIEAVEKFVQTNHPPMDLGADYDPIPCDLEILIGRLIEKFEAEQQIKRMLKKGVVAMRDGNVYQFKAQPSEQNLAAFKAAKPDYLVVNNDAGAFNKAVEALLAA